MKPDFRADLPEARASLPTPCLVVDRPALDANIAAMASLCRSAGKVLRPHAKAHKCAEIARRQVAAGAAGLCVATVGEAERFVEAGFTDIHLTSTLADPGKIARIAALLAEGAAVSCVVDCQEMIDLFSRAGLARGVTFDLLVDLDFGRHRAGVSRADEALRLVQAIVRDAHLRLAGIQAYAGHLSHQRDFSAREDGARAVGALIATVTEALAPYAEGRLRVTGGSTGSLFLDLRDGPFTELQCGSYVFMDTEYLAVDLDGASGVPFEPALFLQSSVISNRRPGLATTDGGDKRLASKYGELPKIRRGAPAGSVYRAVSDEHGQITLPAGDTLPLNTRVECIVPHCDPTINLFDGLYVVQGDEVVDRWPITARGS